MKWIHLLPLAWLLLGLLVTACASDDDDDNDAAADDDDDDDDVADDDAADDDAADDDDDDDDDTADDDTAPAEWQWVAVDGAQCRDSSAAGFAVRPSAGSDKLLIVLQGGGACYDPDSCSDNADHFGEADLPGWASTNGVTGIFNITRTENPLREWNMVFVPYCTGDLHAGSQTEATVPGVTEKQQFVGYQNMKLFLPEIEERFAGMTRAFLAGFSAGGFGTMLNYPQVARTFDSIPVGLLDDSGPLFESDDVLSPCLQMLVRLLWNADPVIEDGCSDCIEFGDGFSGWYPYIAETFTLGTYGLYSSMEDATIRDFFGIGQDHCTGSEPIPAQAYRDGLLDMRDDLLLPTGKWSTYYIEGDTHTFIEDDASFFDTSVEGVPVTDWLGELLTSVPDPLGP